MILFNLQLVIFEYKNDSPHKCSGSSRNSLECDCILTLGPGGPCGPGGPSLPRFP